MKVKGSLYWIYSFTSGCKGKMLVAILLAVIGVLCGMAPYFALAGILSGLIQNTLTAECIFCYVGIAVLGETLKMLFNTVSSLKAHRVAYHILGNGVFQKLEYIYVPLMLSASTTADELSQAITARGIDNPRPKTCAVSMQFHIQDYVLCFVAIVLVIIAFVLL